MQGIQKNSVLEKPKLIKGNISLLEYLFKYNKICLTILMLESILIFKMNKKDKEKVKGKRRQGFKRPKPC